jgi:bifunctional ADP-heptose synthase (sugar kinase/adenylyltransferase)
VDRSHIVRAREYRTPVKTRILAGGIHSAKQQIVRIDREACWPLADGASRAYTRKIKSALDGCDAVLLSDYGSGLVSPALADLVRRTLEKRSRRRPVPVLVDSRYRLLDYRGFTTCTPNESEVEQVLVTRGSRGMALFEPRQATVHIPIFGSDEVADVTGAGDTVIATVALTLAAGGSFYEAARLANYAGGLVVMKRGTATVSAQEMADAVARDHANRALGIRD